MLTWRGILLPFSSRLPLQNIVDRRLSDGVIRRTRLRVDLFRKLEVVRMRGQLRIKRPQELSSSLRREEALDRGIRTFVARVDRLLEPRRKDLAVAAVAEVEARVELFHALGCDRRQRLDEVNPMRGDPAVRFER